MHKKQLTFQFLFISTLLFSFITISDSIAEENTKVGLPEGAIARLGKGGINIMRFSPDGSYLAVGTDIGTWLYNVQNGTETALFAEHTGHVNALAFSQDGRLLASGGSNNPTIQVWDMETKSQLSTIELNHSLNWLTNLSFYGQTLIGNNSREMFYWNVESSTILSKTKLDETDDLVVFSQDGSNFAAADRGGGIRLWDTRTSSQYATLDGHQGGIYREIFSLAFSPDKTTLASGSEDKTVKLWDTQSHKSIATLSGHEAWITSVAFSEDGKTLASGDGGSEIRLWNLETLKEIVSISGHKSTINALVFAPVETPRYSRCLASGSADGSIRFWNAKNGEAIATFAIGHKKWIKAVAFSENDTSLVSAAFDGAVDVWSLNSYQELTTFTDAQDDYTETIMLAQNAQLLLSVSRKGMIRFHPNGYGFSGSFEGTAKPQLRNIFAGEKLLSNAVNDSVSIRAAAFNPYSNILALGSHNRIIALHLNSGTELFKIKTNSPTIRSLYFSPDGKRLAAMNENVKPQVWDIRKQQDITPSNIKRATAVAFSPDSSVLAAISREGIYLWKLDKEPDEKHTMIPVSFYASNCILEFSPDGTVLIGSAMVKWDSQIMMWHVETGQLLGNISGHTEPVETLEFSHNGKILASGSKDGTVLLWDWDKIMSQFKVNQVGGENEKELIQVPEPKKYTSKTEEAEAVMNWLNNNGYQINEISSGYSLIRDGSSSYFSGTSGTIRLGDVKVTVNKEILNIDIENIGSGNFIFDADGNLNPKTSDEEKATK